MKHETEDRLELYALGRLPEADAAVVEEHLFVCDDCRMACEEVQVYSVAMRDALAEHPVAFGAKAGTGGWLGWLFHPRVLAGMAFAAVILAVGVVWMSRGSTLPAMATLQLTAMRSDMQSVDKAKAFDITLTDAPPLAGPLRIELVTDTGTKLWSGAADAGTSHPHAAIDRALSTGDYFVRLSDSSGKLLHEYGFHVR